MTINRPTDPLKMHWKEMMVSLWKRERFILFLLSSSSFLHLTCGTSPCPCLPPLLCCCVGFVWPMPFWDLPDNEKRGGYATLLPACNLSHAHPPSSLYPYFWGKSLPIMSPRHLFLSSLFIQRLPSCNIQFTFDMAFPHVVTRTTLGGSGSF